MNKLIRDMPLPKDSFAKLPQAFMELHYYTEARACNRYDGDDEYYGQQICWGRIYLPHETYTIGIKRWYWQHITLGKGFTAQKKLFLETMSKWYAVYSYRARYESKPLKCNNLDGRGLLCPLLRISPDGQLAGCGISPHYCGYAMGGGIQRPLPKDLTCDIYPQISDGHFEVPGSPLSLREIWECGPCGVALKKLSGD